MSELAGYRFGIENHYRSLVLIDQIIELTGADELKNVLPLLFKKVKLTHLKKNDSDSKSLVEFVTQKMPKSQSSPCSIIWHP